MHSGTLCPSNCLATAMVFHDVKLFNNYIKRVSTFLAKPCSRDGRQNPVSARLAVSAAMGARSAGDGAKAALSAFDHLMRLPAPSAAKQEAPALA